ncbi:MAG TPA: hypothetical protein VMS93_05030 [Candidatus Saccharimonadales bacterium]|nr:hypothetical protein [Candidatus Saccharimonadales bacterium]
MLRPRTWPPVLWAILAAALVLRLPGLTYGLPSLFYHHDEPQIVLRALRFGTGDLNPHSFRWPGTWHMELMFLAYAGLFVAGRLTGAWPGAAAFAAQYFKDPTVFYVLGRVVSLALGLATVPLAFGMAGRAAGRRAAPWAAALLAVNWLHADLSRVTVPSVPMLFWVALALYGMALPGPARAGRSLGIGVACGLAAACLYYGGWALLAWSGVLAARAPGGWRTRLRAALGRPTLLAAAGAVGAFLASCPWALLDARAFLHDLRFVDAQYAAWQGATPRALLPVVNVYQVTCLVLPELLGWPAWLLAVWGAVRLWRAGSAWGRGVLLLGAGFGLLLVASRFQMPRYALPLLPVTCVFAGAALAALPARPRWALLLGWLALGWCLRDSVEVGVDRTRPDTRELAKAWVETHLPPGSRLVVDALHHRNTFTAPLDLTPGNIRERLARLSDRASPYGSEEAYRLYYEYLLMHPGPHPYDQEWTEAAERVRSLAEYRRLGFRYAMVSSMVYEGFHHHGEWEDNPPGRFYGGLERGARLVAQFRGERFLHPGPTIRIYDLRP